MKTTATQKAIEDKIGATQEQIWAEGQEAGSTNKKTLERVCVTLVMALEDAQSAERKASNVLTNMTTQVAREQKSLQDGMRMDATWIAQAGRRYQEAVEAHNRAVEKVLEYAALRKALLGLI